MMLCRCESIAAYETLMSLSLILRVFGDRMLMQARNLRFHTGESRHALPDPSIDLSDVSIQHSPIVTKQKTCHGWRLAQ